MVFKMGRKTFTLQNFVDNRTCSSVRAPKGLAAPGGQVPGCPRMVAAGPGSHSLSHPSPGTGRPGALEQPQSQAPPWGQGLGTGTDHLSQADTC